MLLAKAFQSGLMEGFDVGHNGVVVSHLQFVDDTIVLCKDLVRQLKYLRCVIKYFKVVTGLKVILSKSCIYRVGQMGDLGRLAEVLRCKLGSFPTS